MRVILADFILIRITMVGCRRCVTVEVLLMSWQQKQLLNFCKIIHFEDLGRENAKESQGDLVEEAPAMLVEVVEEGIHLVRWNNFREEGEVPVGGK